MKLPYFDKNFDERTYKKYFNPKINKKRWRMFFDFFETDYDILDFGCGAAWSIYYGSKLGYNIVGLDTTATATFQDFNEFRKATGVHDRVKLYNGLGKLPFNDNSFSMVVCRASFNKFHNSAKEKDTHNLEMERLNEFSRILYGPRIVVITGKYYKEEFKQFDFKVYNWSKKGITRLWKASGSKKSSQEKVDT